MKTRKPVPSRAHLIECVAYDPMTGLFTWLRRPREHFRSDRVAKIWNTRFAGTPAFNVENGHGYRCGGLDGAQLLAHRVAWVMINGQIDDRDVDHINGRRADNRINNLRLVSATDNRRNASVPRHNSSGIIGVSYRAAKARWRAVITVGNKSRHLGYFTTRDGAVAARRAAESELGFHPNHGRPFCA